MFARVITAGAGAGGFDDALRLAEQQLPHARHLPGFSGFFVLTDAGTGTLMIISLWQTREQMEAVAGDRASGIRDEGVAATGLTSLTLRTYDVPLSASPPADSPTE